MDFTDKLIICTIIIIVIYTCIALVINRVTDQDLPQRAKHRHPDNARRNRGEIIDTTEIIRRG